MKSKIIKLSIGIPAYNEGNNIQNILLDVISQERRGWKLEEILVYCDGSTDNTVKRAKMIKNKLIKTRVGRRRMGKTFRLKQIFREMKGDILLLFDADIRLANSQVITNLVFPMSSNSKISLVGGNSMPYPPRSLFEKAVYSTFEVFYESRKVYKNGNNVFGCTGSCMALKRDFAKSISFPKIINEDAYIYFQCKKLSLGFRYCDDAIVYYKLPKSVKDYLRQVLRSEPKVVSMELKKYFGNLVEEELKRPKISYLRSILKEFTRNPLGVSYVSLLNVFCKPFFSVVLRNYKLAWFTADSTK
ncbi:hypothetical protein A2686_00935 [Candidatus Woesebacteria bacterium RIFCSPHIGHO2_01_FULL_38_10]|uniref:Glycosyltransferase 2-like domain-containing protein n=1 Tax=Candidatus Woesebacteria bacterium RIFCSPLOWO2_01_FULL_39_10b TaxID=1802517 RepID=A0A1F8B9E7_9BACT|nr:MAG: hypothetical protein A2686_00935 [Candidatus Woesebacteria bacterium RIFCSPHIGHO2_01_FULL_38_10]OGM60672.1 MAG: hypothetical protein A2892_01330 [Candidatus Woesebacteria bacterium RIFCSPLOWO2_01_FULL_39_10b]